MVKVDLEKARELLKEELHDRDITELPVKEIEWEDTDSSPSYRKPGVLTQSDRKYLMGEKTYDHRQTESNKRNDIRRRVFDSIIDFELLAWTMDSDEVDKVAESLVDDGVERRLAMMIWFTYRVLDRDTDRLATCIENGVFYAELFNQDSNENWKSVIKSVDVSINTKHRPDIDYLKRKHEEGELLLPKEIGYLVVNGELSSEEVEELEQESES